MGLALSVQRVQYGMDVISNGPVYESFKVVGSKLELTFDAATSPGLHFKGTADCQSCCQGASPIELQVAPANTWVKTNGNVPRVVGNTVQLPIELGDGQTVVGVRFDWTGYPQC